MKTLRLPFLRLSALCVASVCFSQTLPPTTGVEVPGMAPFDELMLRLLRDYQVPGGALAVARDGKLLFSRGYGWADRELQHPVQPDSLFRVASISKPVTSIAVHQLVEQGKLSLDAKLSDLLPDFFRTSPPSDTRISNITVRQLLYHTGGWNREKSFDPMFRSTLVANELGTTGPAGCSDIMRYMLRRELDFAPGQEYSYSNFGYCILGRVIEAVSGMPYEQYVRTSMLEPLGIEQMAQGKTLPTGRLTGEVKYYDYPGAPGAFSVFPPYTALVPWTYGGFYLESMDAHGGWVASAPDLLKLVAGIEGRRGTRILSSASLTGMLSRPPAPVSQTSTSWYARGWAVRPSGSDLNWWHDGSLSGTVSLLVRTHHGYTWAVMFNSRPATSAFLTALDNGLWTALSNSNMPSHDLFVNPSKPQIALANGVVNGASFRSGFAPGSWVSIRGVRLAPTARLWNSNDFVNGRLPLSLDGVSVKINGKAAPVYYISGAQLNVQVPDDTAYGPVLIEVTNAAGTSSAATGELKRFAPALFAYAGGSRLYSAAVFPDGVTAGEPAVVAGTRSAKPGDTILFYGTGYGPSPAGVIPAVTPLADPVRARIGGVEATVTYSGLVGAGLVQMNIVLPNLPPGNHEVITEIAGVESQRGVYIHYGQ